MHRFHLPAKQIKRRNQEVVYIKASDKISDFLRCVGASEAVFTFEDSRIQRDFMNSLTRLDNCELANEMKSIRPESDSWRISNGLRTIAAWKPLPIKLQHAAMARKTAAGGKLCGAL